MKPLIVLMITFAIAVIVIKTGWHRYNVALTARVTMSVILLFTSIRPFDSGKRNGYDGAGFCSFQTACGFLTGFFEIITAITLHVPSAVLTGWLLIVFLS